MPKFAKFLTLIRSLIGVGGFLISVAAHAACSSYLGKVVFNEVQDPSSGTTYLELRILDPSVIASTSKFAGWKVDVYKNNVSTKTSVDLSSVFTNAALNSCGQNSAWIRIPDAVLANYISGSNGVNTLNFVLYQTASGGQVVDILRLGAASSFYGAGTNYASCSTIESALPSSKYDSAWLSNGNKDWFRTPDGTGNWGNAQTANNVNSICSSNDGNAPAQIGLSKVASATTVALDTNFDFTLFAQNGATGNPQTNVVVSDNLTAAGLTFVSCTPTAPDTCTYSAGTGILTWTVGTTTNPLALNTTRSATLTVKASTIGTKTNTIISSTSGNPSTSSTVTITGPTGPDHIRLNHMGSGVTCTGSSVTVNACSSSDASGVCATAYTSGVTGNVVAKNGATVVATVPFTITAGSSSATVTVPVTSVQTVTFETSGLSVTPTNSWTCWNGSTASCSHGYVDTGFVFDVPNHIAEVLQTVNISSVKKSDNSLSCIPAFASVSKSVTFTCGYTNPATGTLPVRVNGSALNASSSAVSACDAGGKAVTLAFDATGVASTTFQYADVGNMTLNATYTGSGSDAGLTMTGSDTFIAAPKDLAFSVITAAPIKAGNNFSATVTARNNASNATPNFGKETSPESVRITHDKYLPTGAASSNGIFTGAVGAFINGVATASNLNWSEVGIIDLTATLVSGSYLASGLTATGTTGVVGAVGRFIPDHFDTAVALASGAPMPCPIGLTCPALYNGFVYSGQPFSLIVTAKNGLIPPTTTVNYNYSTTSTNSFSKDVTLTPVASIGGAVIAPTTPGGTLSANTAVAASFALGSNSATTANPVFTFATALTAPTDVYVRADQVGTDAVSSLRAPAAGSVEGGVKVVSGRIKIPNAYGSELLALPLTATVQYYSGTYWLTSQTDNATSFDSHLVTATPTPGNLNASIVSGLGSGVVVSSPTTSPVSNGVRVITLNAPLVRGSADMSLLAPIYLPSSVGRATFGVYKSPLIYRRENY